MKERIIIHRSWTVPSFYPGEVLADKFNGRIRITFSGRKFMEEFQDIRIGKFRLLVFAIKCLFL